MSVGNRKTAVRENGGEQHWPRAWACHGRAESAQTWMEESTGAAVRLLERGCWGDVLHLVQINGKGDPSLLYEFAVWVLIVEFHPVTVEVVLIRERRRARV